MDNTQSIVAEHWRFATWGYRKQTQFWGNCLQKLKSVLPRPWWRLARLPQLQYLRFLKPQDCQLRTDQPRECYQTQDKAE